MSPLPDQTPDQTPDLTPEQEAVRRLLADARHDAPTPPEVVARLDETLSALVAGREAGADHTSDGARAPVVDLASRRRRFASMGLLAASAVVVAGVALGQVLPGGSDDGATSADSAGGSSAVESPQSQLDSGGTDSEDGSGSSELSESAPQELRSTAPGAGSPSLSTSSDDLDQQLLGLRGTTAEVPLAPDAATACETGATGPGRRVLAEVDGQPGLVVLRRPDGAAQQAEVYVCGITDPVRTVTLPAP